MLLSVCMMVRDEEANLPRCLDAVGDLADEIVVVDTGSADRTMDICRDYGARVYEHAWGDDFSLHRNQSLSYARGDWVMILDADEEISRDAAGTRDFLRGLAARYTAGAVRIRDMQRGRVVMEFNTLRFFRRGRVRYEQIVHNLPVFDGMAGFCPHLSLTHYGYDFKTPEEREKKYKRTMGLLEKRLREDPDDPQPLFYMSQMLDDRGRRAEALEMYGAYIDRRKANPHFNESVWFSAVKCALAEEDVDRAGAWLDQACAELVDDLDVAYAALEYGIAANRPDVVFAWSGEYIRLYDLYVKDPVKMGGRFCYAFGARELVHALFHRSVMHLRDGTTMLGRIGRELAGLGDDIFRKTTENDLARELGQIGVSWINQ